MKMLNELSKLLFTLLVFCTVNLMLAGPRLQYDQTALDSYVHEPDDFYEYKILETKSGEGYTSFIVDLVSQRFLTKKDVNRIKWRHSLIIVKPDVIQHQTGMLVIDGGDNDGKILSEPSDLIVEYSRATGSVVAELGMVPNQPLTFVGEDEPRWEDALIAFTWDKYLKTGDERWPARMAMTKSAIAAMDAIQSVILDEDGKKRISKFVVVGASKRGWTTWTTAAVDDRVEAIVPIVIDLLNLEPSFEHHWRTYGFWAPAIQDYVDMETVEWWRTPELRALFNLVGPFSYKERYQMPKLLVNALGDEFFLPTSSQFYFDQLPGEKYLRYVPNADHSLSGSDALETVLAFYASVLNDIPRPKFSWEFKEDGDITVSSETSVEEVKLWSAVNPKARDFRKETIGDSWQAISLDKLESGVYKGKPGVPSEGWKAYFIELSYPTPFGIPLKLTTPVRVLPDTLPFDYEPPKNPKKGFLTKH